VCVCVCVCEQPAQGCYLKAQVRGSNLRPLESHVQHPNHYTTRPHRTLTYCLLTNLGTLVTVKQVSKVSAAYSALMLLVARQEGYLACKKTECWGTGMVICLE